MADNPLYSLLCIAIFMMTLTIGTTWHVVSIDVKYTKEHGLKNRAMYLIVCMTIVGAFINFPIWWMLYQLIKA